ncbi:MULTISPECIES: hypothetical protein [Weeksellaceae]|uniref:hypothetical protein n=1 Tax=Weeksellaceae TaxID=2762318 RepID=UPI000EEBA258|nr:MULTISPECIES: hypothetical protein [unclassified Empedobacter]HAD79208.1 hypothetical protein [Flavobacteriaceae bacterium]
MKIQVNSFPEGAIIRNENFDIIGKTPNFIDKEDFLNQSISINYGDDSKKMIITEETQSVFVEFEKIEEPIITVQPEVETQIVNHSVTEESVTIQTEEKSKFSKNSLIWVALVLFLLAIGGGVYFLSNSKSEIPTMDIHQQLTSEQFSKISNEQKIEHYLYFEDQKNYQYLKSLFDLTNLHYWEVDGITETMLNTAFYNGSAKIQDPKNEILSISKEGEFYKVDLKYTYTNKDNVRVERFPFIYIRFNENGLINYIDNKL